jgi:hypothetical protein
MSNEWLPRQKPFWALGNRRVSKFSAAALLIVDVQKAIDARYRLAQVCIRRLLAFYQCLDSRLNNVLAVATE